MFYSHEVLTSRKYGVATVWLVATLGSKSSLKRINRKQILDVDVAKACQTIVNPVAPMALRLQGSLLYGVSRVYLQQCGYVLSDAQNVHNAMQMMLRTVKNLALDLDAGKARPEQLVLPDDPSFLPEFALAPPAHLADLDLDLDFLIAHSGESQSLTPFGSQSSSQAGALGGLVLPTSSPDQPGGFELAGDDGLAGPSGLLGADDLIQLEEPDFTFDIDGNYVEGPPSKVVAGTPAAQQGTGMHSDAGASARVRREHEEGHADGVQLPGDHMNLDLPILGDDLPEGEAFPTAGQHHGSEQSEVIQSTSTASAPLRRKPRAPRVMAIDTVMELRNKDLSDWNANYLENMDAAVQAKSQALVARQAKKDAEHFLWGGGIGGIADQFLGLSVPNPFDMFIGDNLFALITGVDRKKTPNAKRDRDSGIDEETQKESRRVRQKTGEPDGELGRGLEDEGFFLPAGDEGDVPRDEVEIPRDAATALDDHQISSAMPWNNSASVRLSSAIPRSGRAGMMDRGRSGSRTRSPLHGRGPPLNSEALRNLDSDANFSYAGDEFALPGPSSPPTAIGGPVPQARDTLPVEGGNFLDFVTDAIVEKRNRVQATFDPMSDILQADAAADIDDITFEELLPPRENSKVVACHGLMMVLSLGMKGMLDVQQREGLGDINVKLTLKAKASQIVEISDGEESEESDGVEIVEEKDVVEGEDVVPSAETGHFEEQFQAGHAAADENMDNHNSLYDD